MFQAGCGHRFCHACKEQLGSAQIAMVCPACQTEDETPEQTLACTQWSDDFAAARKLKQQTLRCEKSGCEWTEKFVLYAAHLSEHSAAANSDKGAQAAISTEYTAVLMAMLQEANKRSEKLTADVAALRDGLASCQQTHLTINLQHKQRTCEKRSLLIKMSILEATHAENNLKIEDLHNCSRNGSLLWRIDNFKQRTELAKRKNTSEYSPPFYTAPFGYKVCARIYLNGDGEAKGTHMSLFLVVMRGDFDALLPWPFRHRVTLMIVDQSGNNNHKVDAFGPDSTPRPFDRPVSNMNIASGCPTLLPLDALTTTPVQAYVKDDVMFVRITTKPPAN